MILNWNGVHYLQKFLPILISKTRYCDAQFYVADNGSTDGSIDYINSTFPYINVIRLSTNLGFAKGYNEALKIVDAQYFMILNSDVEITEGWLKPLVEFLDCREEVGVCMPKIKSAFYKDYFEYAGASGGFIDYFGYPFCRGRILSHIERDCGQYDCNKEIFWASGAAMLIKSDLYRKLGGFDDNFFAHMEEIDLCWRAKTMGYQVWVVPESVVYHVGGGTLPNNSPKKLYLNYRNNLLMLYKNLPSNRLWAVIFARMLLDGLSAVLYFFQGKRSFFDSVISAHKDFYKMRKDIIRHNEIPRVNCIYRGSIVFSFFASFMKPKFINLESKIRQ